MEYVRSLVLMTFKGNVNVVVEFYPWPNFFSFV